MAGVKGAEIRKTLSAAGIPDAAITTTSLREGCENVRDFIQNSPLSMAVARKPPYHGIYMHPARPANAVKARKMFYVAAKEFILSGRYCYCLSLTRLVTALTDDEYEGQDFARAHNTPMIFVSDFFERGAGFPLTPWQAGVVRGWIKDKFELGGAISLLGDTPLADASAWWPPSFIGYLSENLTSLSVS